jgi:hypothetical protein
VCSVLPSCIILVYVATFYSDTEYALTKFICGKKNAPTDSGEFNAIINALIRVLRSSASPTLRRSVSPSWASQWYLYWCSTSITSEWRTNLVLNKKEVLIIRTQASDSMRHWNTLFRTLWPLMRRFPTTWLHVAVIRIDGKMRFLRLIFRPILQEIDEDNDVSCRHESITFRPITITWPFLNYKYNYSLITVAQLQLQ